MKSVKKCITKTSSTTERMISHKYTTLTSNLGFEHGWIGSTTIIIQLGYHLTSINLMHNKIILKVFSKIKIKDN
jgi:hypothetical protein